MQIFHELEPIYQKDSKILILGSMPSQKSREKNFYYAHPKNRFWQVLSKIYQVNIEDTTDSKIKFLKDKKIALWDVIESCTIKGSSDSSIKNVTVNPIKDILEKTNIKRIYTTGKTAYNLYQKYIYPKTGIEAIYLPSTSPANAKMTLDKLVEHYRIIKDN